MRHDFGAFANIVEEDSNAMHAVMMTSQPRLLYWEPATLEVMKAVVEMRETADLSACYTIDAGPNVHVICLEKDADAIHEQLQAISGVLDIRRASPGGPARLLAHS